MDYIELDEQMRPHILQEFGETAAQHMHFDDGFTLAALDSGKVVGFAAFVWRQLKEPLNQMTECFIDIIETRSEYRRMGVASTLLEMAEERAKSHGAYQLRAWSSQNKDEALRMWAALGFGLAPAVIYPGGEEVHGYFVARPVNIGRGKQSGGDAS